eukprot:1427082-Pyramimonas_sp.AAC.1
MHGLPGRSLEVCRLCCGSKGFLDYVHWCTVFPLTTGKANIAPQSSPAAEPWGGFRGEGAH